MLRATAGQVVVNSVLPEDLRDHARVLTSKSLVELLDEVGRRHPDKYRQVVYDLSRIGHFTAQAANGLSFGLEHLKPGPKLRAARERIRRRVEEIQARTDLSEDERNERLVQYLREQIPALNKLLLQEESERDNPLARFVTAGVRGNPNQLRSLLLGDLMYLDHHGREIPLPILHSYSQGLRPIEYFASSFGSRSGLIDQKLGVAVTGAYAKLLNQAAHRLIVTAVDGEPDDNRRQPPALRGLPSRTDDDDNVGALLAGDFGGHKRNTVLTPQILADLRRQGIEYILVRSPTVGGPPDGGLYSRDVGVREKGILPPVGDYVGLASAQALSEVTTQGSLSAKHGAGRAGTRAMSGFDALAQLVSIPREYRGGATHATVDGRVTAIRALPQGGHVVEVDAVPHHVMAGRIVTVKVGDEIEAGDVMSDGLPNPAEIVRYKGIGEGRRRFVEAYRENMRDAGFEGHRRHIEVLARALVNHVRFNSEVGDHSPDDVVPYSVVENSYVPRPGAVEQEPEKSRNMYLERPVLHYTIGTKLRPSVIRELSRFGVRRILAHRDPPPFDPEPVRGMENLSHDPDWMTRFLGAYHQRNLLKGVQRGDVSDELGTSYVPILASAEHFGRKGKTVGYQATPAASGVKSLLSDLPLTRLDKLP